MTLLIKNVLMIDGSGRPPANANVLVKNDKIAAIGYFPNFKADEVVDGMGAYLAPGFIDINSSSDLNLSLFSDPGQKEILEQGITTIIGGQNGISLAPIFYGTPELNKFWARPEKININWHTVKEFLNSIERWEVRSEKWEVGGGKFGVNFGTLVGHATMKESICGDTNRDLTPKEIDVMKLVLENSLKDGAFGLSLDLTFPLTSLSPEKELRPLFEIVEKFKALASVKLRAVSDNIIFPKEAKDKLSGAVDEMIKFAKDTGVKIQFNNFSCLKGLEKDYKDALEIIASYAAAADIGINLHPFDETIAPLFYFLPSWARRGSFEEILKNIGSKEMDAKIKKDWPAFDEEKIKIYGAPGNEHLKGKSLKEFCENRNLKPKDGLLELMRITNLRASANYKNLSLKVLNEVLISSHSTVSSSLFGRAFPAFLELVLKNKIMAIEGAVRKITGTPAKRLGIKDRGYISDGYAADLTIFRESGIETVIVNGKIAVKDGKFIGTKNGKVLRR